MTVTTAGGTSGAQAFTVNLPPAADADQRLAESRNPGHHGGGHADGHQFLVGATTVAVGGGGVTVTNVVVGSATSLTANFVLDVAATAGPRTVTVTTAGGTSGRANLHDQSAADRFQRRSTTRAVRRPSLCPPAS